MVSPLTALNRAHGYLDELFALHQEALVDGAYELAVELFGEFRGSLGVHMRHEEELVIPIYGRATSPRWPVELFSGQHQKMLGMLDRIAGELAALRPAVNGWRRHLIVLLESEALFKHLAEHHHLAEDQALYPTAAAMLGEADGTADRFIADWRAAESAGYQLIERARAHLR